MANSRPKILLVDDDRDCWTAVEDILSMFNYEIIPTDTSGHALQLAKEIEFDAILISVGIPDNGFALSQELRKLKGFNDIPMAFITKEEPDHALMMEAQFYGGMFLFHTPFEEVDLLTQLSSMVRIKALQDELHERMAELDTMASTDPLTGLYNRRFLFQRLEEEVSRASRRVSPLCLLFIDIDYFKNINDSHGHQAGDMVLKQLATIFRRVLRVSDVVGRIGGEEFIIMLPDTHGRQAKEVAERLRQRVENAEFIFEGTRIPVTVSMGVYFAGDAITAAVDDIVQSADAALYEAKEGGRNKVVYRSVEKEQASGD